MLVAGIDLSGPANAADTCLAIFTEKGKSLNFLDRLQGADDQAIFQAISSTDAGDRVVIGIDAPLSYNPAGGDRPSDAALRNLVLGKGGGVGVMTPTMTRMVYLTLRGISLARTLETLRPGLDLRIMEIHPGACMLLRGAPAADVRAFKRNPPARRHLLHWMETQGLKHLPQDRNLPDHFVAACAAALGAWQWSLGRPVWIHPAQPPVHPYDFAC